MIKKLNLQVFVEDNWDIVQYLHETVGQQCQIIWVSNFLDQSIDYPYKVSSLQKALELIEATYLETSNAKE